MNNNNGFLIVPDAPTGLELGIDCISYEIQSKFLGISLIPVGLHFIYHNVGVGMKQGFFIHVQKNDLFVCPWSPYQEEICPQNSSNLLPEAAMTRLRKSIVRGDLNDQLGAYPFSQQSNWNNLSCCVSLNTLTRCNCQPMHIIHGEIAEEVVRSKEVDHEPNFVDIINFEAKLNEQCKHHELLTSVNIDKSLLLEHLQTEHFHTWNELVGELQLSFLLFILLYSHSALNHWKKLLSIICQSEHILRTQHSFTVLVLRTLFVQLNYAPVDFFVNELTKENFVLPSLASLFVSLESSATNKLHRSILEPKKRLLNFVQNRFDLFNILPSRTKHDLNESMISNIGLDEYATIDPFCIDEEDMPAIVLAADYLETDEASTKVDESNQMAHSNGTCSVNLQVVEKNDMDTTVDSESMSSSSKVQLQNQFYSWRYPYLYDEMIRAHGAEDLIMTASRVIETDELFASMSVCTPNSLHNGIIETEELAQARTCKVTRSKRPDFQLVKESHMFIEFETQHL